MKVLPSDTARAPTTNSGIRPVVNPSAASPLFSFSPAFLLALLGATFLKYYYQFHQISELYFWKQALSELLDFLCYVIFYDFVSVKIKLVHIRELFVHILTNNSVADPSKLWEQNWKPVSDDILYKDGVIGTI